MVGILCLLFFWLFVYGYGFPSGGKKGRRETSHGCSITIRTGLLLFWCTLARVESRRRHYFRDELYTNRSGAVGIEGARRVTPYGENCVLQACWRTCFSLSCATIIWQLKIVMKYHNVARPRPAGILCTSYKLILQLTEER